MDWLSCADVYVSELFEASADSEADSDINKNMDHALLREDMDLAEGDALSCSWDGCDSKDFDRSTADQEVDFDDEEQELVGDNKNSDDNDVDVEEEEEEGAVDQLRDRDHKVKDLKSGDAAASPSVLMEQQKRKKRLKVCADSVKEFMNERDKDRVFWETCLAS